MRMRAWLCVLLAWVCAVRGDVFLHNPRGGRNRYEEVGDTLDSLRLFNAETLESGGYCWAPPMRYVEGSKLLIEWTTLFGCGTPDSNCATVLQYMCTDTTGTGDVLRDGQTTTQIPATGNPNATNYYNLKDSNGEYHYGLHESFSYYQECNARSRNKGLFTATAVLQNSAMSTRQNPSSTRYGFECSEERDYYPYWHPSPWKDIAIFASDPICDFYQTESQNVKERSHCTNQTNYLSANNEADCNLQKGTWVAEPSFGIPAPDCFVQTTDQSSQYIPGTFLGQYWWTLPTSSVEPCIASNTCNCALRIRYNVTSDISNGVYGTFPDYKLNGANYPFSSTVDNFTIALNPSQDGRVFQDRSFMFHISPRPSDMNSGATIYNLNVKGKKGNDIDVFPAVTYGFVPANLQVGVGDYIHFQWTGCDNNTATTAGQGEYSIDRSNIVQIPTLKSNIPLSTSTDFEQYTPLFDTPELRFYMALLGQTNCGTGTLDTDDPSNCAVLNRAGQYFDGGLIRMNNTGNFTYMCSRNNGFSNRAQKGTIEVLTYSPTLPPPTSSSSSSSSSASSSSTSSSSTPSTSSDSSSSASTQGSSATGANPTSTTGAPQENSGQILNISGVLLLFCTLLFL